MVKQEVAESPSAENVEVNNGAPDSSPTITTTGITVTLQLPDLECVQHVLKCALGEVTSRMATEYPSDNYLPYAKEIKRQMGKFFSFLHLMMIYWFLIISSFI